jgi:membrane-bound serine protease (ClpP class)
MRSSAVSLPRIIQPASDRARLLCILMIVLGLMLPGIAGTVAAQSADPPEVVLVSLDDAITPVTARYINRAIADANERGVAAIVLEIDTPGGLMSAMDDIIRDILESDVPVIAYVSPNGARAASAGTFITYAAHVAAMAPGTRIGSASPVSSDGSDLNETMAAKVTNDAVAQIVNLANLRGRNAEWAEQAVREAANITADEASQIGVVDLLASDLAELLSAVDGRVVQVASGPVTLHTAGAVTDRVEMTWIESLLQLLAEPTVAYLLLSLGSIGLFLELSNPGAVVPGVVGGLALLLGLFLLGTLPVDWTGVLLIVFGMILLIVDVFVPSFGILTVGGFVSFILGSYLLFGESAPPGYDISPVAIWSVAIVLAAFFLFIGGAVLRAQLRKPTTGKEGLLGAIGEARTDLNPDGMVFVEGELWQATATAPEEKGAPMMIQAGSPVVVSRIQGLHLSVRPATAQDLAPVEAQQERQASMGTRTAVIPVSPEAGIERSGM